MKRALDLMLIALALPLLLPLLALVAGVVLCTLGRPVLFGQRRIGKGEKPFMLYKFRTMRPGSGTDRERLTRVGAVLRAASLDELPEFWNILKGEMSLVGPRPLPVRYLPRYTREERRRHEVLPGLTGWAQVNGRNALDWKTKFRYDLDYVNHYSLFLDLKILFMTVWEVFHRDHIAHEGEVTMSALPPRVVPADDASLEEVAEILLSGGVAVIPTDTVYGLAALPTCPEAVERLYTIKQRAAAKPIALLAANREAVAQFLGGLDDVAARLAARHWPGALTLVLPRVGTDGFEGLRVPDHVWTRALLKRVGGVLRVTSANLSGQKAATDVLTALREVGLEADIIVDGGVSPGGVASTVLKVARGQIAVLREGPVQLLTLASGSPRRAKILESLGVDFTIVKSEADEVAYPDDPERTVRENALRKGAAVEGDHVLSADTIVWFDNRIFGKPRDLEEAKAFLRILSGKTHTVFTGVAYDGEVKIVKSFVTFRPLSEDLIADYVRRVHPTDRAGAYDIDESGDLIVAAYEGSYENIMGLPVEPLKEWGIAS